MRADLLRFDVDLNGSLDPREFEQFFAAMGSSIAGLGTSASKCFKQLDTDGDGNVSFDEFFHQMESSASACKYVSARGGGKCHRTADFMGGSQFCSVHTCSHFSCKDEKPSQEPYCEIHTEGMSCMYVGNQACQRKTLAVSSMYCEFHTCYQPNCHHSKPSMEDWCSEHKDPATRVKVSCKYSGTKGKCGLQVFQGDSEYCSYNACKQSGALLVTLGVQGDARGGDLYLRLLLSVPCYACPMCPPGCSNSKASKYAFCSPDGTQCSNEGCVTLEGGVGSVFTGHT